MGFGGRVLGTALLIGAGAAAIGAVVVAPRVLRAVRPAVRESLRRGFGLYERARAAAAEFVDDVEDLVAEVRADVSGGQSQTPEAKPTDLKQA
ncbi:MAG: DUF5132 domain-containing protein [Hyphomonadaceae bacterium]